MKKILALAGLLVTLGISTPMVSSVSLAQSVGIVETATVAASLQGIKGLITSAIDKAQNTGNYLLFKAGTELRSTIDTWERANSNLLNKAFRELNNSQRQFFANAEALATKINRDGQEQVEGIRQVAELINQTAQDVRIFDGSLGLFRYAPRIVYPGIKGDSKGELTFTVRGVNFDRADPQLVLPDGKHAKRITLLRQEAVFKVPATVFTFQPTDTSYATLSFTYLNPTPGVLGGVQDFFSGRKNRATTQIAVMQLPQVLGTFTLQSRTRETIRTVKDFERVFSWTGRNESKVWNQGPHDNNWRIIISSLQNRGEWGEAGKGCSVINNNEHGFSIEVRTGKVRKGFNPDGPGYQNCRYTWQEFIDHEAIRDQPVQPGQLTWTADVPLVLPDRVAGYLMTFRTWHGLERTTAATLVQNFYEIVEQNNTVILRPQIPNDLNGL